MPVYEVTVRQVMSRTYHELESGSMYVEAPDAVVARRLIEHADDADGVFSDIDFETLDTDPVYADFYETPTVEGVVELAGNHTPDIRMADYPDFVHNSLDTSADYANTNV